MEHIVIMSSGSCPAAYGATNVRDHMVRNRSAVSLRGSISISISIARVLTRTANLPGKPADAHKDTHTSAPVHKAHSLTREHN